MRMKEKKLSKIKIISVMLLLVMILTILPSIIMPFISNAAPAESSRVKNSKNGVGNIETVDSKYYEGSDGNIEDIKDYTSERTADKTGKDLYCIEHNVNFHGGNYTKEGLYNNYNRKEISSRNSCVSSSAESYRALQCDYHEKVAVSKPDLAFILTYKQGPTWNIDKQFAIWASGYNGQHQASSDWNGTPTTAGVRLYNMASEYKEFYSKTAIPGTGEEKDKVVASDIHLFNNTENEKIKTSVDSSSKEYIIGPFKIDYNSGIYQDIMFGGITNMYGIGYDRNGKSVQNNILIKQYYYDGKWYDLKEENYFKPADKNADNPFVEELTGEKSKNKIILSNNKEFYIKIASDKINEDVFKVKLHIDFGWMNVTNAEICYMQGYKYALNEETHNHYYDEYGYTCKKTFSVVKKWNVQDHMNVVVGERKLFKTTLDLDGDVLKMDLGGTVWEEKGAGKESTTNGLKDNNDRVIPNVKVTLYTHDGKVAKLLTNPNEQGISDEEVMHRINPTYTDSVGNYLFRGLNPMQKYYVRFEYNGQTYLPTDYLKYGSGNTYSDVNAVINTKVDADKYNTANWNNSSKGTEPARTIIPAQKGRKEYDHRFENIESSPLNYKSTNSLNSGKLVNGYNETFSQYELMGFVLESNGKYHVDSSKALIDGFYTVYTDGNIGEIDQLQEGIISKEIKEYIKANKESPDAAAMKTIYRKIAGNDTTLWRKLQFIEDCKMSSYTQKQGKEEDLKSPDKDLYPVYNKFTINTANSKGEYNINTRIINKVAYPAIYPGQLHVNQGLWRRQETDLALRKDIAFAATRVNGKTEVYKYDKRGSNDDYWQIQLRMRDYNNYYGANYTREVYKADYAYRSKDTNGSGKELELYVTYKITVRNNSQSILTEVKELVDYYDKDYTYVDSLSWITYAKRVNESEYHNTIDTLQNKMSNTSAINSANASQYGEASHSDMRKEHNYLYIKGLEGHKLKSGEEAYVYLTFKVNKDGTNPVKLDDDGTYKQNYAEINGYSTYYKDNTKLPNGIIKNSTDVAGLIDFNSTPGNLSLDDLVGDKPEKNFENDTDRAKSIKVTLDTKSTRSINGTVWEDKRTQAVAGAMIGNGVRDNGETTVQGVTVELVEKLSNGKEYVWQTTTTDKDGRYEFKMDNKNEPYIIPGNYIVRFKYGHNEATVKPSEAQKVSYNGQDFKSTVYQQGLGNYTEREYNIQASDAAGKNLSDAMDIWTRREAVNAYSNNGVTNEKAEILISPYANPIDNNKIGELIKNTNMIAETKLIVLNGEYNRTTTDGEKQSNGSNIYLNGNDINGNYTLNNVDFGLVERPKAQLELGKKVTNVKVTLANGSTLFDAVKGTKDLTWTSGKAYELNTQKGIMTGNIYKEHYSYRDDVNKIVSGKYTGLASNGNGLINVTMDDELMHGATIQISYELTVTNVGEVDYNSQSFYYKGTGATENNKVTTKADVVLDYVSNNLQYREKDNNGWSVIKPEGDNTVVKQAKLDEKLTDSVKKFNTVLQTGGLNKNLKPGEKDTTKLVLTQLMTSQNTDDDRAYNNIAEITTISNSVGRRMAFSVQGNQDPTTAPAEVDSVKSEKVVVLPPFGIGNIIVYITIAIVTLAILSGGIILIKKKVLKK